MVPHLSDGDVETIAEIFRTLGQDTRLRLIDTLHVLGEKSVGELEALTGVGQPGLSQQLAILRKAGLVATRRAGKLVYYSLDAQALAPVAALLSAMAGTGAGAAPSGPGAVATPRKPAPRGSAATFAKIL